MDDIFLGKYHFIARISESESDIETGVSKVSINVWNNRNEKSVSENCL